MNVIDSQAFFQSRCVWKYICNFQIEFFHSSFLKFINILFLSLVFPQHKYGTFSVPNLKSFGDQFDSHPQSLYPDLTQVCPPDGYHTSPVSSSSPQERYACGTNPLQKDDVVSKQQASMQYSQSYSNDDLCRPDDQKCVTFASKGKPHSRQSVYSISKQSLEYSGYDAAINDENSISPGYDGLTMDGKKLSPIMKLSSSVPCCLDCAHGNDSGSENAKSRSFQPTPPVKHLVEGIVCTCAF